MIFQMDNARPHTAMITQRYLTSTGVSVVKQSPYSPDMNLCDRYLFPYVKNELKNIPFDSAKEVETELTHSFRHLSENALSDQLKNLREHCKLVVESPGDYISSKWLIFIIPVQPSILFCTIVIIYGTL